VHLEKLKKFKSEKEKVEKFKFVKNKKMQNLAMLLLVCIHSWKKAGSRDPGSHDFFGQN